MFAVPTDLLFDIAERENIIIGYHRLLPYCYGCYVFDPATEGCYIALEQSLRPDSALFRCVLAHELGHHFCPPGYQPAQSRCKATCWARKGENLATRWAVDLLVPQDRFETAGKAGYNLWEMVEIFAVLPEFITRRAELMERSYPAPK